MNRAKAIKLLDMLRRRTEANGATPAEAMQAVELAEKLMKRYKINADDVVESDEPTSSSMELQSKLCPWWASLLAFAIERRFKLKETRVLRRVGKNAVVSFVGAQHVASVAAWLFAAIANDVVTRATRQAREAKVAGGALVKFRNQFCQSAALELYERLNPPTEQQRIAWRQRAEEESESRCSRRREREVKPLSREELLAMYQGAAAGRDVSIDTNAISSGEPIPLLTES